MSAVKHPVRAVITIYITADIKGMRYCIDMFVWIKNGANFEIEKSERKPPRNSLVNVV